MIKTDTHGWVKALALKWRESEPKPKLSNNGGMGPETTKSTLTQIPLLSTKALIAYTSMNKANHNDWFRISAANPEGMHWWQTGNVGFSLMG